MAASIKLSLPSVKAICGNSDQVMVYGYGTCLYKEIAKILRKALSPVKKVFDWRIGQEYIVDDSMLMTTEKTEMQRLDVDFDHSATSRACKAALTNLVFENYKRKSLGLPLIPVIFALDIDGNRRTLKTTSFTSKHPSVNTIVTHSEVRRCYKLCEKFANPMLRQVAQETFKFVKVKKDREEYRLEQISAPWKSADWSEEWAKRKGVRAPTAKTNSHPWRKGLALAIQRFDTEQLLKNSSKEAEGISKDAEALKESGQSLQEIRVALQPRVQKIDNRLFISEDSQGKISLQKSSLSRTAVKFQLSKHGNGYLTV
jgi:hypothetical protein